MSESSRLFFALLPDDTVHRAAHAAARDLRMKMQPGGWLTPSANYHVTLVFIGNNVPKNTEDLMRSVGGRVHGAPFQMVLNTTGSFKTTDMVWWLGLREIPEAMADLRRDLYDAVTKVGITPERQKFVPHLTFNRGAEIPLPHSIFKPIDWPVSDFALVRSTTRGVETSHEVLERWSLTSSGLNLSRQQSLL